MSIYEHDDGGSGIYRHFPATFCYIGGLLGHFEGHCFHAPGVGLRAAPYHSLAFHSHLLAAIRRPLSIVHSIAVGRSEFFARVRIASGHDHISLDAAPWAVHRHLVFGITISIVRVLQNLMRQC